MTTQTPPTALPPTESPSPELADLHRQLQQIKSPLLPSFELQTLDVTEAKRALALLQFFEPQSHFVKKTTLWLFGLAGLLWIPLFFSSTFSLSSEFLDQFRLQQYRLYLFLMSLWGYGKYRRAKQYEVLLQLCAKQGKQWYQLAREDIQQAGSISVFESLTKYPASEKKYLHLALHWLFLGLSVLQLARQILFLCGW